MQSKQKLKKNDGNCLITFIGVSFELFLIFSFSPWQRGALKLKFLCLHWRSRNKRKKQNQKLNHIIFYTTASINHQLFDETSLRNNLIMTSKFYLKGKLISLRSQMRIVLVGVIQKRRHTSFKLISLRKNLFDHCLKRIVVSIMVFGFRKFYDRFNA